MKRSKFDPLCHKLLTHYVKVIYTNGCIDRLVNWIHSNLFVLGGVALGLAIPQVTYPVKLRFHNSVKTPLVWGRAPGTQAVTLLKGRC